MMEDILSHYNGKLYTKEIIENWDLPQAVKEQIEMDNHEFFFLTSSKEKEHGDQVHVHLSIYPSKYSEVYLLEVKLPVILPEVLHKTLSLLRDKKNDIITSTGFCKHKDLCHYGIFFSTPNPIDKPFLIAEIKKMENIAAATIYQYSCTGCSEV